MSMKPQPLPDPPPTPFGAVCSLCKGPRVSLWAGGGWIRACGRCDRVDRWPVRSA